MSAIRVVMADDSPLAREVLRDILTRDGDIEIVGEATNGQEAVEMARRLSPQLITMDLTMPIMDGLSAIEEIMHTKGVPIVVISDRSDAQTAYRALEVGALEVLPKPGLDDEDAQRLLARVRLLAGVSVITRLRRRALRRRGPLHPHRSMRGRRVRRDGHRVRERRVRHSRVQRDGEL